MVPKPRAPPCFPICAPSALLRGLGASSRFLHRSLHHSIDGPLVHPLLHPRRQNITALSLPSLQPLPPSSLEPPPSRNPTTACPSTYRCDFVSPSDLGRHRLRPPAPTHISTPLSRSRKRRLSVRHLLRPIPGSCFSWWTLLFYMCYPVTHTHLDAPSQTPLPAAHWHGSPA